MKTVISLLGASILCSFSHADQVELDLSGFTFPAAVAKAKPKGTYSIERTMIFSDGRIVQDLTGQRSEWMSGGTYYPSSYCELSLRYFLHSQKRIPSYQGYIVIPEARYPISLTVQHRKYVAWGQGDAKKWSSWAGYSMIAPSHRDFRGAVTATRIGTEKGFIVFSELNCIITRAQGEPDVSSHTEYLSAAFGRSLIRWHAPFPKVQP